MTHPTTLSEAGGNWRGAWGGRCLRLALICALPATLLACTERTAGGKESAERILDSTLQTLNAANQKIAELEKTIAALEEVQQRQAAALLQTEEDRDRLLFALGELGACLSQRGFVFVVAEADLQFAPGRSTLPATPPRILKEIASILVREPDLQAKVEGFTDNQGSPTANLALSNQRAAAIKAALVGLGIDPKRIQTEGLGQNRPLADNDTPEGRARNRRVEIYLQEND